MIWSWSIRKTEGAGSRRRIKPSVLRFLDRADLFSLFCHPHDASPSCRCPVFYTVLAPLQALNIQ